MTKKLQVANEIYEYPEHGNGNWGEEATAWAEAVTDTLANVVGPNDVLLTSANLINNQSTPANVSNLIFNTADVLGIEIEYFIKRVYNPGSGNVNLTERGTVIGDFNGTSWQIVQESAGDAGVDFTILNSGQVQYTSTNLSGHVSSQVRYRARTIDVA